MSTQIATETVASISLRPRDEAHNAGSRLAEKQEDSQAYKYARLLPVLAPASYPPLVPFNHVDPALRALSHPDPRAFLRNAEVIELTPNLGSEIRGISLVDLDSDGRDQLALEVARRGLVVFRDQQAFVDSDPQWWLEFGQHFGRLHIHPTSGHPEGLPELHLVYRDVNSSFNFERPEATTSVVWHSDVSYELQPPGLTTFFLVAQPTTGGDTLFISQVSALKRLSEPFRVFLRTLKVVHSGVEQAEYSRAGNRGGIVRREPVEHIHPLVRRHPVTGEEALYVNRQFSRRIVGLKQQESDNLLNFLYEHIEKSGDLQARLKWTPYTVAIWDNRITSHTAILDYAESKQRRHGVRITPQAERPIPANPDLVLDN